MYAVRSAPFVDIVDEYEAHLELLLKTIIIIIQYSIIQM